jgi:hypothetical protein
MLRNVSSNMQAKRSLVLAKRATIQIPRYVSVIFNKLEHGGMTLLLCTELFPSFENQKLILKTAKRDDRGFE